jgi:hypothetical protein
LSPKPIYRYARDKVVPAGAELTPARDEQQASGNELQPRALPAQCERSPKEAAAPLSFEPRERIE